MTPIERIARAIAAGQHAEPSHWGAFVNHAGLALQAVREPSADMIAAGSSAAGTDPAEIWRAMIDAAQNQGI